jgi:hypothetical protein
MKIKNLNGFEWDTEGHSLRFVYPFVEMMKALIIKSYVDRNTFKTKFSLTNGEFEELLGMAEKTINEDEFIKTWL